MLILVLTYGRIFDRLVGPDGCDYLLLNASPWESGGPWEPINYVDDDENED